MLSIQCPHGCPLGKKSYKAVMKIDDEKENDYWWNNNCSKELQSNCKLKQGSQCIAPDNFMRQRMLELHWK